jgi:hypothetical protein
MAGDTRRSTAMAAIRATHGMARSIGGMTFPVSRQPRMNQSRGAFLGPQPPVMPLWLSSAKS